MPAATRRKILRYFFENGVLVVSSNHSGTHDELKCLNLYVFQIGRSFTQKGYCVKRYAWTHAYFTLTDDGVAYLRGYFGAGPNVAPATHQPRQVESAVVSSGFRGRGRGVRGDHGPRERGFRGRGRGGRGDRAEREEEAPAQE